jgi:hypothetical protein
MLSDTLIIEYIVFTVVYIVSIVYYSVRNENK